MKRLSPMTWLLLATLTLAVAGVTHVVTVLVLPWRSADDAFARVASLTPLGSRVVLPPTADGDRIPQRDPAMLTALCRFDLNSGPFRIATSPFAESFVTIGFHARHGVAFYGLTVQSSDASSLALVLNGPQDNRDGGSQPSNSHQVVVTAPEAQGFVTMSTPIGDGSESSEAEDRLRHFKCDSGPASS